LKIYVRDLTKDDLLNRNLPKNTTGVVVTKIENDSPIMFLSENDVIVELQKKKVSNAEQFDKMVKNIISKGEKTLLFAVYNNNNQRSYLTVTIK
jgi:serine protease Do